MIDGASFRVVKSKLSVEVFDMRFLIGDIGIAIEDPGPFFTGLLGETYAFHIRKAGIPVCQDIGKDLPEVLDAQRFFKFIEESCDLG